jgi:hypothetical protein
MMRRVVALAIAAGVAAPAFAQSVTLTVDDGRALIVGGEQELGAGLGTSSLDGAAIVAEFRRLCLPDPASAAARVEGSPLQLSADEAVFPASGKQAEARVQQWRSDSATLSVWTGEDANLKGRPIAMPSRGAVTTGPYGPFRADGAQCNMVVSISDFAGVASITDALTSAFGAPGKLVAKKTFADGYWTVAEGADAVRININAPSTRSGPQPVHLSAQIKKDKR